MDFFIFNHVFLSILDEYRSSFDEAEGDIVSEAFFPNLLHPSEITWSSSAIVLTTEDDLFDLPGAKVFLDRDFLKHRGEEKTLVTKRQGKKNRNSLVGTLLILAGDVHEDVLEGSNIRRKAFLYAVCPFRQEIEHDIPSFLHDVEAVLPVWVCLFVEEIACHADTYHLTTFNPVISMSILHEGVIEVARDIEILSALLVEGIEIIHVAVEAAFAELLAAMPRVPDVMHVDSSPFAFHFSQTGLG